MLQYLSSFDGLELFLLDLTINVSIKIGDEGKTSRKFAEQKISMNGMETIVESFSAYLDKELMPMTLAPKKLSEGNSCKFNSNSTDILKTAADGCRSGFVIF